MASNGQLWDKYKINLLTESMLTPMELKLFNKVKEINERRSEALKRVEHERAKQELVLQR
jgi:hypothetical protein